MTKITIQSDGMTHGLTAIGHATGSREVCAAVSAIVYALGGYLKNLEQDGAAALHSFMLESGAAEIEASGEEAMPAFGMAAIGLIQIAAKYPDQVAVDARNFFQTTGVQPSATW